MKIDQIAVILYTVRDACKTPEGVASTLRKISDIGYRAIQISGIGDVVKPGELKKMLADNGLVTCGTHENSEEILNQPEKIVEKLEALGTTLTAYPWPGGVDFNSEASLDELIRKLDHAGAVLAKAGKVLMYHNHGIEFTHLKGKTALQHIYDRVPAAHLQAELDTYWVQYGGGNPEGWCRAMKGRLPVLHMKDYGFVQDKPTYVEIGNGNLDFKAIVAAAESSGCQWFVVEQDTCPGDPFDSIRQSFNYLKANIVA